MQSLSDVEQTNGICFVFILGFELVKVLMAQLNKIQYYNYHNDTDDDD